MEDVEAGGSVCGGSAPAPEASSDPARPFTVASDEEPLGAPGSQESRGPPRADEEVQGALTGPEEEAPAHLGVHELSSQTSLEEKDKEGTKDSGKPGKMPGSGDTSQRGELSTPGPRDEEDVTAEGWRSRRKHVFVLSEAGKPIYSRYGNEEALSATMGVMMALVSFIQSGDNAIRSIYSDDRTLVFLQQGPLVLVAVSRTPQSAAQLRCELLGVHAQIVSVLTRAGVARVFERQRSYDLRRLLAGSERILDSLLDGAEREPGFLLGAVRCLPLPAPFRDSLGALLQRATAPSLAFSILAAGRHLVTAAQERAVLEDCRLDPADLHLLLNLVGASSAFRAGEVWAPVCLPRFNPDGFFYAYVSYLGDNTDYAICLVLLSTDREAFHALAGCKRIVEEGLQALGASRVLAGGGVGLPSYGVSAVGAPDLRHFLYKPFDIPDNYRQLPQFTSPEMEGPYASECERQRLFDLYYHLHGRLHSPSRPLRLIYHVAEKETLLAWVTPKFELYGCFNPLVTKSGAIHAVTKLLRWLKREEDRLFIRYPPKYSTAPGPARRGPNRTDSALENGL
ncbi:vacuolar fusion protein MON1 homolog B isoform X1 [Dromiciops gliroides]|uniref:vacuolar fusion protein MON1 homolog B isoform X1 n=1 Tax=Dromiciops gliroides TaxID=33562 RepID=UPI001CC7E630|nr:vacuolar fusion protein MON1 homolog B isoform X1 [Dromiciops gliroides]XP_043830798.1 vacuolar fusion protein MON1 homolog B isoform X1 [Dromiciops gliroides]